MLSTRLPAIISNPNTPIRSCVIWLHGLGASGDDFAPIVPQLDIQDELGIRFVFPHAPNIPISVNGGAVMPAWYDIHDADFSQRADKAGIEQSSSVIRDMINDEIACGIDPSKIVIAGFSQGGVIAINTGLLFPQTLAGIMALSTYVALRDTLPTATNSGHSKPPIFYAHGDVDPVIPIEYAESSRRFLEQAGYSVEWNSYPMDHAVCAKEIRHIKDWLTKVLA